MSRKLFALAVLVSLILLLGFVATWHTFAPTAVESTDIRTIISESNSDIGYSFSFPSGDSGFYLDQSADLTEADGLRKAIVLIPYADLNSYWAPSEGSTPPPVVNIYVFDNIANLKISDWVTKYDVFSRHSRAVSSIDETTLNGATALRYETDGSYRSYVLVLSRGNQVAVLIGEFTDPDTQLFNDFWNIAASFALTK